jgi:penicillin-binding protein 1A
MTAAYAAVAGGRYPVEPRGLALVQEDDSFASFFRRNGSLDRRRDWGPMLDLLWEATNKGTGRRAALSVPAFGKTGTTQANRDALFIGFAGDLVVGVWVGRDDNKSLGKITGGTAPARIWRSFMVPALAIDRRAGPALPRTFRVPQAPPPPVRRQEKKSPLPEDWSEPTARLRELAKELEELLEQ